MSHENLQQLNQRLGSIQKRLPAEAVATPVIGAISLPVLFLGMAEYYGNDPKMFAALVSFKLACVAVLAGSIAGAGLLARQTGRDISERSKILNEAREKGLQVRGVIFKRIRESTV